jgi:hypothetical protein
VPEHHSRSSFSEGCKLELHPRTFFLLALIYLTPPHLWPNFGLLCFLEPIFFRKVALGRT